MTDSVLGIRDLLLSATKPVSKFPRFRFEQSVYNHMDFEIFGVEINEWEQNRHF